MDSMMKEMRGTMPPRIFGPELPQIYIKEVEPTHDVTEV